MNITCIILAAGESKRLGTSKLFVEYNGTTLIKARLSQMMRLDLEEIIIVTGKDGDLIDEELRLYKDKYINIHNPNFKKGMTGSLKVGISKCLDSFTQGALVILVDQFLIPDEHYEDILALAKTTKNNIICTSFDKNFGAPTFFPRRTFREILNLDLTQTPKNILKTYQNDLLYIENVQAKFDLDTPYDLNLLKKIKD